MERKITPEEILIVPRHYFDGMQRDLQELVDRLEIHDMNVMQSLLRFRDWLKPITVEEEVRERYPDINWNNIPLLLQPREECPAFENQQKDNEYPPQQCR